MQHKVASTTSQPIHTHLPPTIQLSASHRFPHRLFDTRPGVPIDLGSLKTPGNHRRQLLRAPLSGTSSCGYIVVYKALEREPFCAWTSSRLRLNSVQIERKEDETEIAFKYAQADTCTGKHRCVRMFVPLWIFFWLFGNYFRNSGKL